MSKLRITNTNLFNFLQIKSSKVNDICLAFGHRDSRLNVRLERSNQAEQYLLFSETVRPARHAAFLK